MPLLAADEVVGIAAVAGVVAAGVTAGVVAAEAGAPAFVAGGVALPPQAAARLTKQQPAARCSHWLRR
jgi:hypothetical protein